jgi:ATP-binding cassette subfamily B protein
VLHAVTLTIDPREIVGVVGLNGAGKTTLVHLILGLYRPQTGRLYADGRPFDELDMRDLRRQIGVVMQDPIIFPGTVMENIAYGCRETDVNRVVRAAELSMAHELVQTLSHGYDTAVGENGMLLSGGQRQRIAIARALVRQPRLLILDEPTTHLDQASVSRLIGNLSEMADRPAILVISHDTSVLRMAHRTHVLRDGRIVDTQYARAGRGDGEAPGVSRKVIGAYGAP